MDIWGLNDIAERNLDLVNPTTPEKIIAAGRAARLNAHSRVIEFGCGYGEILALWAQAFVSSGIGIELRESACNRARQKLSARNLANRVEIVCGDAGEYRFAKESFDVAACIGSLFIWQNDFAQTIRHMREAIHANGRLIIGEAYWLHDQIPPDYTRMAPAIRTEYELCQICRNEGFVIEWVTRATHPEWDHYHSSLWQGLVQWLEENPNHPDRQEVVSYLHSTQENYFRYGRAYFGWMLLVLAPLTV